MRSDSASNPGLDNSLAMILLHQHCAHLLAGLRIISVYYANDLFIQIHAALAHQLHAPLQRFMPSAHLLNGYQRTVVIDLDDRLQIQHAAQYCGSPAQTAALVQILQGFHRHDMLHMLTEKLRCLNNQIFRRAICLHPQDFLHCQTKAQRGALGINDGQIKLRILLQKLFLCQICRIESTRDTGREAHIQHLVPGLGVRFKILPEHILIDVVGLDISPLRLNPVEILRENGLAVKIIRSINGYRRRNHMKLVFLDNLLGQIRCRIRNNLKCHVLLP